MLLEETIDFESFLSVWYILRQKIESAKTTGGGKIDGAVCCVLAQIITIEEMVPPKQGVVMGAVETKREREKKAFLSCCVTSF